MKGVLKYKDTVTSTISFDALRISLAAPEKIKAWSHGEVKKPETINYRTFKPERDGLFCAKIFGPTKDWECNCGKYKRMKHRGVVCEKCGVEVIQSKVRRERLAHIELAAPVSHVWFFKGLPSRIGHLLDMTLRELERILYFESYVVIDVFEEEVPFKDKDLLSEEKYLAAKDEYGDAFHANMGAEAIRELLERVRVAELSVDLRKEMKEATSVQQRRKLVKRLKVVEAFANSDNRPEWMILEVIPVIPPELRPLVPLDGGRFATSDLNDLYRRVINRNNRLKRLLDVRAPDVIIRNEKRMLQEAVDALFDNGRRGRVLRGSNNRPLKSLSDMLKGKQGRFRQNLLGKRVDYSGRSVIVVGPELKLNQCGLPKKMALELFKPFVFQRLEEKGYVSTIKSAKKMLEKQTDEAWEALEEVIKEHPVLLNRAPTLHRLGIQAFEPVLVKGKAVKVHPLVCAAFNADFDGDQMAVHVPLSVEALVEAEVLMLSTKNILSPASGQPLAVPTQDIVLGCYYMTKEKGGEKGEGMLFSSSDEVRSAYDANVVSLQAKVCLRRDGELFDTTVGRVLLNDCLPAGFPYINKLMTKKELQSLISYCTKNFSNEETVKLLDAIKELGFENSTRGGISIAIDDMLIPDEKDALINEIEQEIIGIEEQYLDGIITHGERYNKIIDIWSRTTEKVADEMFNELKKQDEMRSQGQDEGDRDFNPVFIMADSGARGSKQQIRQLAGMRGLMAKPSGEIIETPITANFREGLRVLQYFISTHGARKGLADTALKTADSGYLTRRLVDVGQDVIVTIDDCNTLDGIEITPIVEAGEVIVSLRERILGRVVLDDVIDPLSGDTVVESGTQIDKHYAKKIEDAAITKVKIRSVLTCIASRGVCVKCYGINLATNRLVDIGEAVGVLAAQSIGEPGTQLTMRTFHIGGAASRIAEQRVTEARNPGVIHFHNIKAVRNKDGDQVVMNRNGELAVADESGREKERYPVVYGATLKVEDGVRVESGEKLVEWDPYSTSILTESPGKVSYKDIAEGITMREELDEITGFAQKVIIEHSEEKKQPRIAVKDDAGKTIAQYLLPTGARLVRQDGDDVFATDILAKIPRESMKTKDITGGLPRVAELFEARKPKEEATISEIDGVVKFGGFVKGMRKIQIVDEHGTEKDYLVPRGKHLNVHEGDLVRAGEPLMDGASNPHSILAVLGPKELQKYLVNEVQEVYRLQGVNINDKHIEVVARQMLQKVKVEDVGDTKFLLDEQVNKFRFSEENEKAIGNGGMPAKGDPMLLGITKASLTTDSFISAASFQETTRVLTEASICGKVDYFRGLKENVIVGRLIPAGTGMKRFKSLDVFTREGADEDEQPPGSEELESQVSTA